MAPPSRGRYNELVARRDRYRTALARMSSTVALAVAALGLTGCGGANGKPRLRPAAEPAAAPPVVHQPAGRTIRVGVGPEGLAADRRTGLVVVAVRDPAQLVMFDARTGRLVRRVRTSAAPRHLQLAGPGGPVLVPEEPVNRLLELALPAGRSRSIQVGPHPHDAAADDGRVFVGNEFGRSVSVIQGTRVVREIGGFVQPGGVVAVGAEVAVVDVGADSLTLIDARTLRVIGRLGAGAGPTHAVAGAGGHLYLIDTRGDAILTYATAPTFRQVGRFPLAGTPYGVAIDASRGHLWVTLTGRNQLVELATGGASLRPVAAYPTGRQPNTVAVEPRTGRVFVANARANSLQIIEPALSLGPAQRASRLKKSRK